MRLRLFLMNGENQPVDRMSLFSFLALSEINSSCQGSNLAATRRNMTKQRCFQFKVFQPKHWLEHDGGK